MQYRLGMLGFLNLATPEAPGNMGLHDQLMGLQWTQDNARYFNGDQNNVTIFGESAGSVSVSLHLISPLSRNLFNRAILQSGSSLGEWTFMSMESSWKRLNNTAFEHGKDKIGCQRSSNVKSIMRCLRSVDAAIINNNDWSYTKGPTGLIQFPWLPSIDYNFLTERPEVSMKNGNFKQCPILAGSNSNEGSWFIPYEFYSQGFGQLYKSKTINLTISQEQHKNLLRMAWKYYPAWDTKLNNFGKEAIIHRYTDWRNPEDTMLNLHNLEQSIGDFHFICPTNKFAEYYSQRGLPTYKFVFSHRSTVSTWGEWMGVMHGDEIFFLFGEPLKPGSKFTSDETQLALHMMQIWGNFSKTG